jgi:hypothetical protein
MVLRGRLCGLRRTDPVSRSPFAGREARPASVSNDHGSALSAVRACRHLCAAPNDAQTGPRKGVTRCCAHRRAAALLAAWPIRAPDETGRGYLVGDHAHARLADDFSSVSRRHVFLALSEPFHRVNKVAGLVATIEGALACDPCRGAGRRALCATIDADPIPPGRNGVSLSRVAADSR